MKANAIFTVNVTLDQRPGGFLSENARQSFQAAAERWDADYVEYTRAEAHHPGALKLKVFELVPHERVFVIDADAIISASAPNPFENFKSPSTFYAVANEQPHHPGGVRANMAAARREIECIVKAGWVPEATRWNRLSEEFCNSGVWLATREHHAALLSEAHQWYVGSPGLHWWDQMALNVAVAMRLGGYAEMGVRWNWQFPSQLQKMFAYVYHFAGDPSRYERIKQVNWRAT